MKRIAALLLVFLLLLTMTGCRSSDYRKAEKLMNGGSYESAMNLFRKLGDYRDSAGYVPFCLSMLGSEALDRAEYKAALLWYSQLLSYDDYRESAAEGIYRIGRQAMNDSDWTLATSCFSKISDYSDSAEQLRRSSGRKSGSSFSDEDFLADIGAAATARMRSSEDNDKRRLVTMEQGYVEQYRTRDFYDSALRELADRYISALHAELEAAEEQDAAKRQIAWQTQEVERYRVLNELIDGYGLCSDIPSFAEHYADGLAAQELTLEGLTAIDEDIRSQIASGSYRPQETPDHVSVEFTNHTEFTYDMRAVFTFLYQVKGTSRTLETVTVTESGIGPGLSALLWADRSAKSASATEWEFSVEYGNIRK